MLYFIWGQAESRGSTSSCLSEMSSLNLKRLLTFKLLTIKLAEYDYDITYLNFS